MFMASHQGVLLSIPYLPGVTWFVKVWSNDSVCWDLSEIADKRRPLNRGIIATAQGSQTLSVPLQGGRNQRVKVNELKILNNRKWQREHVHAMQTAYGKSPYFVHYADELFEIICGNHETLAQLNIALIEWLLKMFRIDVTIVETCSDKIEVNNKIDKTMLRYPQVFESKTGFVSNCSAVDLLFNCGPDSIDVFKRAASL